MIVGVGLEIIDISKWELDVAAKEASWIQRIFTGSEREYCQRQADPFGALAGAFAAKQAALKAFAKTLPKESDLEEVEVLYGKAEQLISLQGTLLELKAHMGVTRCFVSISHTKFYATAVVVLEA